MFDLSNIAVHIEISSNCNSRCLDCGRFVKGTDLINPHVDIGSLGLMSLTTVENVFDNEIAKNLRYINFTGTYGDAITHPKFFEILEIISDQIDRQIIHRKSLLLPEKVKLMIETNGGLHDQKYWIRFADIINSKFSRDSVVIFALDGIDNETHQKYRRGVNFDQALSNAKTLIDHGINVVWSMISFAHNEHQIEDAKKISHDLGFKDFKIRRSRLRSVVGDTITAIDNTYQKKKNINKDQIQYSNQQNKFFKVVDSVKSTKFYFENNKPLDDYYDETDIVCEWKNTNKINVDYTSRVWQCCYFSTFYHAPIEYHQLNRASQIDVSKQIRIYENLQFYEDQYDHKWNFCDSHKLSSILNHRFFTNDLPSSFNAKTSDNKSPRIHRCAKHCGDRARLLDLELRKVNQK